MNSRLQSIVGVFSTLFRRSSNAELSSSHKKKPPHVHDVSPLSTAARVQKKKAKIAARKLKSVDHKAAGEKRASDARAAAKKKADSKATAEANARARAKKKKAKAKAAVAETRRAGSHK